MRLQAFLAKAGIGSRRRCERYIEQGKVKVNSQTITVMGYEVQGDEHIEYMGRTLTLEKPITYALYKPVGVVSTAHDPQGRPKVTDLIDSVSRLYPVGRLDAMSEGLILLTNQGDLAHELMHPRYKHEKRYHVWSNRPIPSQIIEEYEQGMILESYRLNPVKVRSLGPLHYEFTLTEGRNRQIRNMLRAHNLRVKRLVRVSIASLELDSLRPGEYRRVTDREIAQLRGGADGML